jgi:hypothetical protein
LQRRNVINPGTVSLTRIPRALTKNSCFLVQIPGVKKHMVEAPERAGPGAVRLDVFDVGNQFDDVALRIAKPKEPPHSRDNAKLRPKLDLQAAPTELIGRAGRAALRGRALPRFGKAPFAL